VQQKDGVRAARHRHSHAIAGAKHALADDEFRDSFRDQVRHAVFRISGIALGDAERIQGCRLWADKTIS
jgi:hypothetical protein